MEDSIDQCNKDLAALNKKYSRKILLKESDHVDVIQYKKEKDIIESRTLKLIALAIKNTKK